MNIKYVGNYGLSSDDSRVFSPATVTKMNYVAETLVENNFKVDVISPTISKKTYGFYQGIYRRIFDGVHLRQFSTFGSRFKLLKKASGMFSKIQLFLYLLVKTKPNEPVIVYHSLSLYRAITIAKSIRKFKVILEVNEVYTDVVPNEKWRKKELKLIESADAYIFINEILNEKLNKKNKPYVINYGTYKVEEDRKICFEDEKIHVVYAGTLDPNKGGAYIAVKTAKHLPSNYHVHILGFGTDTQINEIEKLISEIKSASKAIVTYDGILSGEQYIDFLQKCNIGLSTQIPEGDYNETSFPSKILVYLANGLSVLTVRIKVLERSKLAGVLSFYDGKDPRVISHKIQEIKITEINDGKIILDNLNKNFICEIRNLIAMLTE